MNSEHQYQAVIALRTENLTPKQIARQLGLRPAEVSEILKAHAEQAAQQRQAAGELDPLVECLAGGSVDFLFSSSRNTSGQEDVDLRQGLIPIVVTRQAKHQQFIVCSYLVDIWCLGVKDALGPRTLDAREYSDFIRDGASRYPEGYSLISLEHAQAIVYSAIEYAHNIGFEPHPDFEPAKAHLGNWDGKLHIECGFHGRPRYVEGPYDNVQQIRQTLDRTVGKDSYDFLTGMY